MTLSEDRIAALLEPYLAGISVPTELFVQLGIYLDLLLRWNARTNLTAIREPEEIVRRHFGESLFAGSQVAQRVGLSATLLDFGSGAGFPGLPIQLLLPNFRVTLAESQGKKSAFLREAVRTLGLSTEVWANRVDILAADRLFDVVALRAVDNMESALSEAPQRVSAGGVLAVLGGRSIPGAAGFWELAAMPGSAESFLYIHRVVPRGTADGAGVGGGE